MKMNQVKWKVQMMVKMVMKVPEQLNESVWVKVSQVKEKVQIMV